MSTDLIWLVVGLVLGAMIGSNYAYAQLKKEQKDEELAKKQAT
jgi:hypothetical protein